MSEGIVWSDKFSVVNDEVDAQHKQLVELVNGLVAACMDGTDTAQLKETLDFLVNYTVVHFNDEEALQLKYNFPEYEAHKKLHEDFKVVVLGLVQEFEKDGISAELSNNLNKIVVKWLFNHIRNEDKKIGDHIRSMEK